MAKTYLELMAEYEEEKAARNAAKLAELRDNPQPEKTVAEITAEALSEKRAIMDTVTAGQDNGMAEFLATARKKLAELKANPPKEIA